MFHEYISRSILSTHGLKCEKWIIITSNLQINKCEKDRQNFTNDPNYQIN